MSPKPLGFLPLSTQPVVRPMFRSLSISASGLSAQRQRMETIAENIANAETTSTPEGGAYRRKVTALEATSASTVSFESALYSIRRYGAPGLPGAIGADSPGVIPFIPPFPPDLSDPTMGAQGVRVAGVEVDATEGPLVYEPGHPDADENGYVRYPNVRLTDEMIDMLDARRVYEANATVFASIKSMLRRALDI